MLSFSWLPNVWWYGVAAVPSLGLLFSACGDPFCGESSRVTPMPSMRAICSRTRVWGCSSRWCPLFEEAAADDAVRSISADAVGDPAASPAVVVGAVDDEAVEDDAAVVDDEAAVDTALLAFSGGRSAPEMVGNACCVATLSGAIARSK